MNIESDKIPPTESNHHLKSKIKPESFQDSNYIICVLCIILLLLLLALLNYLLLPRIEITASVALYVCDALLITILLYFIKKQFL